MLAAALMVSLASAPSAAALVSLHALLADERVLTTQTAPQLEHAPATQSAPETEQVPPTEAAPTTEPETAPEAEPAPAVPPIPTLDPFTRQQLESELVKLELRKPSYLGPVFACAMGAVVVGWGLYIAIVGTVLSGAYYWIAIGAAVLITGGALATVGVVRLFSTIRERRDLSRQIDDIRERLTPVPAVTVLTF